MANWRDKDKSNPRVVIPGELRSSARDSLETRLNVPPRLEGRRTQQAQERDRTVGDVRSDDEEFLISPEEKLFQITDDLGVIRVQIGLIDPDTGVYGIIIQDPLGATTVEVSDDQTYIDSDLTASPLTFASDLSFTSSDWNTVAWGSGTVTLADGVTTYSILAGNTGNLPDNTVHYLYLNPSVSTTVLQLSNTVADIAGCILLATVARGSSTSDECFIIEKIGIANINRTVIGANAIDTPQINAGAVDTNELAANAVTAAKIEGLTITAAQIATGTITANEIATGTITANEIATGTITANEISGNTITANKLASLSGGGLTINFAATGTQTVLGHTNFTILADGTATFSGSLSAASGTFAGSLRANSIAVYNSTDTLRGYISAATSGSLAMQGPSGADRVRVFNTGVTIDGGGASNLITLQNGDTRINGHARVAGGSSNLGFFGSAGTSKSTVNGSRSGGAALTSLLSILNAYGLITDNSSA